MKLKPNEIYEEFLEGTAFKAAMGSKGIAEQTAVNERFYIGDQWHGAKCGNDRPLVRHNIIKRIGDYKISQILNQPISVSYSAEGIPSAAMEDREAKGLPAGAQDINYMLSAFGNYYSTTAERVRLNLLNERLLKNAFISGTSVLYTYWDSSVPTGLYADESKTLKIKGDISSQVLDINNVVFGDPYCEDVQEQPFIIIRRNVETEEILREARINGADINTLRLIEEGSSKGKTEVFTKFYKKLTIGGEETVRCIKSTAKATVRGEFDTGLSLYPVAVFCWERRGALAYGESEVTYLIPNQIAINRMITANVWSAMTTGMPIMVVNGDTVNDKITNEPGQIIKVYGSSEDIAGAVKYVTPPNVTKDFDISINTLIENTMTQSGANEVALGDSRADNATALMTMRNAALTPLQLIKNRFYVFSEEVARIWADFWITYYGRRSIKLIHHGKTEYIPFDGFDFKGLVLSCKVDISNAAVYDEGTRINTLLQLFDKGIIDRRQLLERMPEGSVKDISKLLGKEDNDDGI